MNLFEFSSSTMAEIIGWTQTIIGNVMPLLVVILGIGIGLWILSHFLHR